MSPKPPYTPEPIDYQRATELLNQLCQITEAILPLSSGQDLPALNQLVFQRGELVEKCRLIPLKAFNAQQRQALQETLDHCQKLDVTIEKNMRAFREEIDGHLKHLKQSQNLLEKYHTGEMEGQETRSRDA